MRFILTLLLGLVVLPTMAGPLDEARAREHLKAIASGDIEMLMANYAEDAYMDWVGGPLEGRYYGREAIKAVWKKFIAANDGKPRIAEEEEFAVYGVPSGVSIEAEVEYTGKKKITVWHVLVYRDGTLVTEIWQNHADTKTKP